MDEKRNVSSYFQAGVCRCKCLCHKRANVENRIEKKVNFFMTQVRIIEFILCFFFFFLVASVDDLILND